MPCNCYGDLYKYEIVDQLQKRGYDVKSVHALNLIMEKMGLLDHYANGWDTTEKGLKFQMGSTRGFNCTEWHPELVDGVAKFLESN